MTATLEGIVSQATERIVEIAQLIRLHHKGENSFMGKKSINTRGLQTRSIHGGEAPDPVTGASTPNIVMSTSFVTEAEAPFSPENLDNPSSFFYTREGNPTVQQLEHKLMALEQAQACVAFGSGMAAISALMLHVLKPGDHVVMSDVAYVGAAELLKGLLPSLGIEVSRVDMTDLSAVAEAMRPRTKLVHIETPCNPIVRLSDISAIAEIAHAGGAKLSVDSTFATPIATQPLEFGADFVVHSLSKYLCGHGDAIGGALLGSSSAMAGVRHLLIHLGGVLSPFNAWLIMRGMATLPMRMRTHEQNALSVARFLANHPAVTRVTYPGLPSHPQHALAVRQMRNFSGMIAFQTKNASLQKKAFAQDLEFIHYAVSLGHQRSLLYYVSTAELTQTSYTFSEHQLASYRDWAGDGVFRFSVGLEDSADLIADLDACLIRSPSPVGALPTHG
jgi:cystathionine beta-lyase/cystathionine gamma-synthase